MRLAVALRPKSVFTKGMSDILLVLTTFPDVSTARHIGTVLVEKQLVACVNLLPECESIYRWQGKIETAKEVVAVLKIRRETYLEVERELTSLHPYETPEIVAIEPSAVASAYGAWVVDHS